MNEVLLDMVTVFQGYPDFDRTSGAAYVPGICDWSEVTSNSDLTLPSCTLGEFVCMYCMYCMYVYMYVMCLIEHELGVVNCMYCIYVCTYAYNPNPHGYVCTVCMYCMCMYVDVTCPGHNEHDVLEFSDFLGQGETYTNKEVRMHVCMYVCMYVYICVYMYVCIYVCMYVQYV